MFRVVDADNGKQKFVARTRCCVIDNRDPLKRGRVRVDHPVVGETGWIPYLRKPSEFDVPNIGSVVYAEAESGYPTHMIAFGEIISGKDESPDLPEAFRRDVPTNRGFHSPGGHTIEIDDGIHAPVKNNPIDTDLTTENRGIRITSIAGNKVHLLEDEIKGNQYILIEDVNGNFIKLDFKENKITINSTGSSAVNTSENKDETVGGNFNLNISGNANITASGAAFIDGSAVLLGGGGPGVSRLGDRAVGTGNLGAPVTSTIIQGSPKVLSG
jgi:hypothetical protein